MLCPHFWAPVVNELIFQACILEHALCVGAASQILDGRRPKPLDA